MSTTQHPPLTLKLARAASLAALSCAIGGGAQAAQATASASGTVVAPIAISSTANLVFGTFAPGAGGTVTVSTSGVRQASGPILMTAATPSAARFNISGEPGTSYSITHSGTAVLTNSIGAGAETMTLTKFSDLSGANATSGSALAGTLDGAGNQSLYVGGTLAVGAAQVPGVYIGTVVATVEYN